MQLKTVLPIDNCLLNDSRKIIFYYYYYFLLKLHLTIIYPDI